MKKIKAYEMEKDVSGLRELQPCSTEGSFIQQGTTTMYSSHSPTKWLEITF